MRFHVVALPHTVTSKAFCSCAYTQKVLNFCKMMRSLGHEVFHYGGEGSEVDCTEHITTMTAERRQHWWGQNDTSKQFYDVVWSPDWPYWVEANQRAIEEISKRLQPHDFICLIGGTCQKPIADAFPNHMAVEYGIGYEGIFAKYRVFESYAWMHHVYGKQGILDGVYYDEVIPNYYDPADFEVEPKGPGDYYLFVARLIARKGLHVAAEMCRHLDKPLYVVGQGITEHRDGYIKAGDLEVECPGMKYLGTVGVEQRKKLMAGAAALIMPTQYIGPFEGVTAEAMLCGTPVITTDWGCFAETVQDGVDGFRTRSIGEMVWAAEECEQLDRFLIRKRALERWSTDVVRWRYQAFFERLLGLWEPGKDWHGLPNDPRTKRDLGHFR